MSNSIQSDNMKNNIKKKRKAKGVDNSVSNNLDSIIIFIVVDEYRCNNRNSTNISREFVQII